MAVGRPIKLTPNVARKTVSITATASQTTFTPTGGYRIGDLAVYRNGVRLVNGRDFTAVDGANVVLQQGATVGDVVEFGIFDSFNIADAVGRNGNQTIGGDLVIGSGTTLYSGSTGIVSTQELRATTLYGDGSNLTGIANTGFIDTADLTVSGIATFNGVLNADAEVTAAGGVDVTGGVKSAGIVSFTNTTDSTSSTTGALIISGGVGIAKSLFVGNNVTIGGTVTYEDVTNVDSVGIITARLGIIATAGRGVQITAGGLNVDAGIGTFDAGISLPDDQSITLGNDDDLEIHHAGGSNSYIKNNTLALDIRGDTTNINSKNNSVTFLKANASGLMATTGISSIGSAKITDSTASTSTTTGALVVTGGVGIAGSLHVGENVTIGGTVTYEDVTNIDSVGVITARLGVKVTGGEIAVGAAFSVGQAGVVTATSYYGDGSTLTNAGITAGKAMGLAAFLG